MSMFSHNVWHYGLSAPWLAKVWQQCRTAEGWTVDRRFWCWGQRMLKNICFWWLSFFCFIWSLWEKGREPLRWKGGRCGKACLLFWEGIKMASAQKKKLLHLLSNALCFHNKVDTIWIYVVWLVTTRLNMKYKWESVNNFFIFHAEI